MWCHCEAKDSKPAFSLASPLRTRPKLRIEHTHGLFGIGERMIIVNPSRADMSWRENVRGEDQGFFCTYVSAYVRANHGGETCG